MHPDDLPKKHNRTPPIVDPDTLKHFRAYRQLSPWGNIRHYRAHREDEKKIKKWAEATGLDRSRIPYEKHTFEWGEATFSSPDGSILSDNPRVSLRVTVKCPYEDEPPFFDCTYKDKGDPAHLGDVRNRPWVGKHVVKEGVRQWEPEKRTLYDRCNSYDRFHGVRDKNPREKRWLENTESYNSLFQGIWELGYSKKDADLMARKYWLDKIRETEKHNDGTTSIHVVFVTIEYDTTGNGDYIELASHNVGGVEGDDKYIYSVIYDVFKEALEDAKKELPKVLAKIRARLDSTGLVK